jgi:sec-independent protein translocase protein TatB
VFDIGFSELVLVALLALIVLGPKRLPEVARTAGRWVGRLRRFVDNVKQDFDRELHTAELSELRKLKEELNETRRLMEDSSRKLVQDLDFDTNHDAPKIHYGAERSNDYLVKSIDKPKKAKKPARTRRRTKSMKKPTARMKHAAARRTSRKR